MEKTSSLKVSPWSSKPNRHIPQSKRAAKPYSSEMWCVTELFLTFLVSFARIWSCPWIQVDLCGISRLLQPIHRSKSHPIFHRALPVPRNVSQRFTRLGDITGNKLESKMPAFFTRRAPFNKSAHLYNRTSFHERRVYMQWLQHCLVTSVWGVTVPLLRFSASLAKEEAQAFTQAKAESPCRVLKMGLWVIKNITLFRNGANFVLIAAWLVRPASRQVLSATLLLRFIKIICIFKAHKAN